MGIYLNDVEMTGKPALGGTLCDKAYFNGTLVYSFVEPPIEGWSGEMLCNEAGYPTSYARVYPDPSDAYKLIPYFYFATGFSGYDTEGYLYWDTLNNRWEAYTQYGNYAAGYVPFAITYGFSPNPVPHNEMHGIRLHLSTDRKGFWVQRIASQFFIATGEVIADHTTDDPGLVYYTTPSTFISYDHTTELFTGTSKSIHPTVSTTYWEMQTSGGAVRLSSSSSGYTTEYSDYETFTGLP